MKKINLTWNKLMQIRYFQHLVGLVEDVPGSFVECGVGGGTTMFMLLGLTEGAGPARTIWGFDSFEGLPAPTPEDDSPLRDAPIEPGTLSTSEEEVRERLARYGVPPASIEERVKLVPGWFPASFSAYDDGPIALLHLDVDLYASYRDCVEWFEPRVAPGGVIAFDEYGSTGWPGATQAIEEYFGGPPPNLQRDPGFGKLWFMVKS